jgi:glycosyltransferase involved in cell wall biosynthesis
VGFIVSPTLPNNLFQSVGKKKMKIAIDISSTKSDHKFRGIGFYTQNLVEQLKKLQDKNFQLITFSKQKPTVDLYHFPAFSPFFFSLAFNLINQSVITIHDLIPLQFPKYFSAGVKGNLRWQIQKRFLKKAKKIITDSQASKKAITEIANIPQKKIEVVYLGANPVFKPLSNNKRLQQIGQKFNLPKKFVLYVGDLNWNKNVNLLAQACIELKLSLVVVGKQAINQNIDTQHPWNQELAKFQKLAQENKEIIKCLGFVSDEELNAIFNLASCLVCPSLAEGFGLPVLEAMQAGCPVICSNSSSLPEVGGEAVLYFDPRSKTELKKQLEKIWENPKMSDDLRKKGIEQAKKFSWQKTAQQTLEIYKNCA